MKQYQERKKNAISVSAVRYSPYDNLDFIEKCLTKWLKRRNVKNDEVFEGEVFNSGSCIIDLTKASQFGWVDEDIVFI